MIYILRFSEPLGDKQKPRGQARFYVGYCEDGRLNERLTAQRQGKGAAITAAAVRRGLSLAVVATLPGGRDRERQIKRWKNTPRLVARLQTRST